MELFGDELSGWGAAAVGSLLSAILLGMGVLAVRFYRARGGYAKDVAEAGATEATSTVAVADARRKAAREDEEAKRQERREDEEVGRRRESAILKEYRVLAAEQREEIAEQRELVHKLRDQMQVLANELAFCRAGRARADERISSLEEALDNAKIPHRPWLPDRSGPHDQLPGDGE